MTRVLGLAVLTALVLSGCASGPADRGDDTRLGSPRGLVASLTQYRPQEGSRELSGAVVNERDDPITVSEVSVEWAGLAFPTRTLRGRDATARPGEAVAFTLAHGPARCAHTPTGSPVLVAVVDARRTRLPLRLSDPGLLERIRDASCAAQTLARTASVGLELSGTTVTRHDAERLPARVVLRRAPAARAVVRLVDLGGSVLFSMRPRDGAGALPAVLAPDESTLSFPVVFGAGARCDAHSRGQSQQSYLFSAYLRVAGGPTQRHTFALDVADRSRLAGLLDRECARGS